MGATVCCHLIFRLAAGGSFFFRYWSFFLFSCRRGFLLSSPVPFSSFVTERRNKKGATVPDRWTTGWGPCPQHPRRRSTAGYPANACSRPYLAGRMERFSRGGKVVASPGGVYPIAKFCGLAGCCRLGKANPAAKFPFYLNGFAAGCGTLPSARKVGPRAAGSEMADR